MDFLFKSPPFSSQEKQLEEEFGLRTKAHPAPIESIIKDDSRRCCYVSRNFVLLVAAAIALLVLCHRYLGPFLDWISELNGWQGPLLLCLLFVLVSFPMAWGYIIINLGAGYIYGLFYGTLVTIVGANIGALVSFVICRRLWRDYVLEKLSTYDNLKQVVRVIEGRQGFRIIMMTRLTPVPFGLQNALFSTAKISKLRYVGATFIGLLPTQVLNTYMGSTLRSMEDVMAGKQSSGIVLIAQVLITVAVTYIVNMRMKKEVHSVCEQERQARQALEKSNPAIALSRVMSMQALPVQLDVEETARPATCVAIQMEDVDGDDAGDSAPIAPLPEAAALTANGQFVRGHRRSQSAGSALKSKDYVIKLPSRLI
eukprot:m.57007 g.57007  ORF g.57007 m.57007 type:complete len:369 (-) comp6806_c0_seq3:207-1313(-)